VIFDLATLVPIVLSRVRASVTNNNGFWIGWLDLLALLLQLPLITITYNSSQSVTVYDSFHSFLDHERLLIHCDWLARIDVCPTNDLLRVESYVTTDWQSAILSWDKAPIWGLRPDFYYCPLRVCWCGALSLTRMNYVSFHNLVRTGNRTLPWTFRLLYSAYPLSRERVSIPQQPTCLAKRYHGN
jgi:hypothetical protein